MHALGRFFVRRQLFRRVFLKAGRLLAMFPVVSVLFLKNRQCTNIEFGLFGGTGQ